MKPTLNDSEYRRIRDWLVEEFGLRFGPEKRDILRSRLDPLRAELGFESFEQLFLHLKFHPDREDDRLRLFPYLTNNESYFFREPAQLDILRDEIIPAVAARREARKQQEIRILSAGCASGEEPYTLGMVSRSAPRIPAGMDFRITGIDIDPDALGRGREGVYGEHAFRRTGPDVRRRYFRPETNSRWRIIPSIREIVRFERVNLVQPDWPDRFPRQDVIFCRNVLIYFDENATRKVVQAFYEALEPGGYLFLGHSESLSRIATQLVPVRKPGAFFYQRPEISDG